MLPFSYVKKWKLINIFPSPFANNGSLITPTACSSQAAATSSAITPVAQIADGQIQVPAPTAAPSQAPSSAEASITASSPVEASPTASEPAEASATGSSCLDECNAADNACRFAPDANFATCASEFAACVGYV
jgi:hypothetical protein